MGLAEYLLAMALNTTFEPGELVNKRNVTCMAQNIWFEAQGEDLVGQIKVGTTVMKRLYDSSYPDTVCSVIWKPGAFSWTNDHLPNSVVLRKVEDAEIYKQILAISIRVLSNDFSLDDASTHYWAHKKIARPCWKDSFDRFEVHGNHTWAYEPNGKTTCWDASRIALKDKTDAKP